MGLTGVRGGTRRRAIAGDPAGRCVVARLRETHVGGAREAQPGSWDVRPGGEALGKLLVRDQARFAGPVLTTNFGNAIDPAFKRRLTYRVTFPFPDEEMREQLWRSLLPPQVPVEGRLDFAIVTICFLNGALFPETHRPIFAQKLLISPLGALFGRLIPDRIFMKNLAKV